MPRFSRGELAAYHGHTVPDLAGPGLRLLFVGINPGLWTAATQTHFARPGNRFYPALLRASILERPIRPSEGMTAEDRAYLVGRGIGISNIAPRATARADEVTDIELREGAARLSALVTTMRPRVVAVLGISAYRVAFGRPKARTGRQLDDLGGAELWVVPNPSGLNAHHNVESLAIAYAEAARAAGILSPGC